MNSGKPLGSRGASTMSSVRSTALYSTVSVSWRVRLSLMPKSNSQSMLVTIISLNLGDSMSAAMRVYHAKGVPDGTTTDVARGICLLAGFCPSARLFVGAPAGVVLGMKLAMSVHRRRHGERTSV